MLKITTLGAAGLTLASLAAAPALAQSPVTFVSGKGTDAGNCAAPASPCRTFQYALGLTNAGGEIKALDPANYFFLTINKSINITGVDGAGIIRGTAGDAVTINGGANDVVSLSNLTIDGVNRTATNGIKFNAAGILTIHNCTLRNFSSNGLILQNSTGAGRLFVTSTRATNNGGSGVQIAPTGPANVAVVLADTRLNDNSSGLSVDGTNTSGTVQVTAQASSASRNTSAGFSASQGGPPPFHTFLFLDGAVASANSSGLSVSGLAIAGITHSTLTQNGTGVSLSGGTVESHGNNAIRRNFTEIAGGALTPAGLQ